MRAAIFWLKPSAVCIRSSASFLYCTSLEVSMQALKNEEKYFECSDEPRPVWYISCSTCPFGDHCKMWSKYKSECWSCVSADNVKAYIKRHGMNSSNHHAAPTDSEHYMSEEMVDVAVETVEVLEGVDTKADREQFRASLVSTKKRKDAPASDVAAELVQVLTQAVVARPIVGPPGILMQSAAADPMLESLVGASSSSGLNAQTAQVTVPVSLSQLQLLGETVRRSKEAVKSSMQALMGPLNTLKNEVAVLHNAEQLIEELSQRSQRSATP